MSTQQQTICSHCGTDVSDAKFCPECGSALYEVATEQPTVQTLNGTPPAGERPQAGQRNSDFRLRIFLGAALVLAVVGFGLGLAGFLQARSAHSQNSTLRSQVTAVRHQIHATDRQIQTAQGAISTLKANSQAGVVTSLQGQTGKLTTCLPELQQEVNGLNVNTSSQNGWLTSAFLQNPTIISSTCAKTLNGPSTGP